MSQSLEEAVFAGGCFWCMSPVFSQLKGVQRVVAGYIGGHGVQPTYQDVCRGDTGYAEAVQITFNPSEIDFVMLLEIFLVSHDPTTLNRQGHDIGTQYRSAVFCQNDHQRQVVKQTIDQWNAESVFSSPIVTEINAAEVFYPAENYHQNYFDKNPTQPYCLAVVEPKVAKIRQRYATWLK